MDKFGLSLLPAAAQAGLDTITVSRHVPLFRRAVGRHDTTLIVAPCTEPHRFIRGDLVLLLTRRRLVITRQTRPLHRVRGYVSAELAHLSEVDWEPKPRIGMVDFRFTADGRAHHTWVRAPQPGRLDELTTAFGRALPLAHHAGVAARR